VTAVLRGLPTPATIHEAWVVAGGTLIATRRDELRQRKEDDGHGAKAFLNYREVSEVLATIRTELVPVEATNHICCRLCDGTSQHG